MKRTILILFACLFAAFAARAQQVVVSEYRDDNNGPAYEWTELLVTGDNLNMVGYIVRDNAASGKWQGGVRFKDHPIWRHLRSGTIIVIKHRGTDFVAHQPFAGYIEVGAENSVYFEKYTAVSDWSSALDINGSSDMIQILNATGNHVHVLGHNPVQSTWDTIPQPKAASSASIMYSTNCVAPGYSLAAYNCGMNNDSVCSSVQSNSRGVPNQRTTTEFINQLLWRSLRQPVWIGQSLSATYNKTTVQLNWNKAEDVYPDDSTQGYLIVRFPTFQASTAKQPVDGVAYNVNDKLGSATVIANVPSSQTVDYTDMFALPCGQEYIYRVYAYRYAKDPGFVAATDSVKARGRAYNEQFAQVKVTKEAPVITSFTVTPSNKICSGSEAVLRLDLGNSHYKKIEWLKNGNLLPDTAHTIIVTTSGVYEAHITNEWDCTTPSESITITVVPTPQAETYTAKSKIFADTLIVLCPGETIKLTPNGGQDIRWFNNNAVIASGPVMSTPLTVSNAGTYFGIHTNDICSDTSVVVRVAIRSVRTDIAQDTIDINFNESENRKSFSSVISNLDTLNMPIVSLVYGAKIIQIPVLADSVVGASNSKSIGFDYVSPKSGTYLDSVVYELPCGARAVQYLRITKTSTGLTADPNPIVNTNILPCNALTTKLRLIITNPTSSAATLVSATLPPGMAITPDPTGQTVSASGSLPFELVLTDASPRRINDNVVFTYNFGGSNSTLAVALDLRVVEPKFSVSPGLTEFALLPCETSRDSVIHISNSGTADLHFTKQSTNALISFMNLPLTVPAGESKDLKIRVTPTDNLRHDFSLPIEAEECATTVNTGFSITKDGMIVAYSDDEVVFPEVVICSNQADLLEKQMKLMLTYNSAVITPKITEISITGPFTTSLSTNTTLGEVNDFKIFDTATAPGTYSGLLTIKLSPCDFVKLIPISIRVSNGTPDTDKSNIDFSSVDVGTHKDDSFTIFNRTGKEMIVSSIAGFTTDITLVQPTVFPATIPPDGSLAVTIRYNQSDAQDKSTVISIETTEPCTKTIKIPVSGKANALPQIHYTLYVPDTTIAVNDSLAVPVYLHSNDIDQLVLASPDRLSFDVDYNATILAPYKVVAGSALDPARVRSVTMTKLSSGKINVDISLDSKAIISANPLVWIHTPTYLGNDTTTLIQLSNHQITANPNYEISSTLRSGWLLLTGPCAYSLRILDYVAANTITVASSVVSERLSFTLASNGVDHSRIELISSTGVRVAQPVNNLVAKGEHSYAIPATDLSSGVYYLVLYSGSRVTTVPVRIVK